MTPSDNIGAIPHGASGILPSTSSICDSFIFANSSVKKRPQKRPEARLLSVNEQLLNVLGVSKPIIQKIETQFPSDLPERENQVQVYHALVDRINHLIAVEEGKVSNLAKEAKLNSVESAMSQYTELFDKTHEEMESARAQNTDAKGTLQEDKAEISQEDKKHSATKREIRPTETELAVRAAYAGPKRVANAQSVYVKSIWQTKRSKQGLDFVPHGAYELMRKAEANRTAKGFKMPEASPPQAKVRKLASRKRKGKR